MKRMLALCLATCFLFCPPAALGEQSAQESNAREKLEAFGIFREEAISQNLTRGELARYALRIAGATSEQMDGGAMPFVDVAPDDSDAGSILGAYHMGLMEGTDETHFEPDSPVDAAMLAKVMVSVAGYGPMARQQGGYPTGYLMVAAQLGILEDVSGGDSVSAQQAERAFLKTLESPVMDMSAVQEDSATYDIYKNETLLQQRHHIYRVRGVMESDEYSSLLGPATVGNGYVQIDGEIYRGASPYLGYRVECYYREENGERELVYAQPYGSQEVIRVDAEDIQKEAVSAAEFVYEEDGRQKSVSIHKNVTLLLNGKQADFSPERLCPALGDVTLIDSDGDGKIDVVRVRSLRTVVVDLYSKASERIVGKYGVQPIELDEDGRTVLIEKNGETISPEALSQWNVILAEESQGEGKNKTILYVSDKSVEGAVGELGEDYVIIGETRYPLSEQMSQSIPVGSVGIFYLDADGRIAARQTERDNVYGFLHKIHRETMGEVSVRLFTENNRWVTLELAPRVSVNGSGMTAGEAYTILENRRELIVYNVSDERQVYSIWMAADVEHWSDEEEEAWQSDTFRLSMRLTSTRYRDATQSFENKVFLNGETKVFLIPEEETASEEDFSVTGFSSFTGDEAVENISVYDMDPYGGAGACVILGKTPSVNKLSNLMLIYGVHDAVNQNGEVTYLLEGMYKGYELKVKTKNKEVFSEGEMPQAGDIIQFALDSYGQVENVSFLLRASSGLQQKTVIGDEYSSATFFAGEVLKMDASSARMTLDYGSGKGTFNLSNRLEKIMVYDPKQNRAVVGTLADLEEGVYCFGRFRFYQANEIVVFRGE